MMRLEHINLVVKEIEPTLNFLLTAFPEWSVRGSGSGEWGSTQRCWIHVGNDDYYITLNDKAEGKIRDINGVTPGVAHIAFVVDDLASLIERLTEKGFEVEIYGRKHPFRQTVYFNAPSGFQFEFIQYHSDKPEEKNMYGGETGELNFKTRNNQSK
ncbi:MAG: VOC family protein [Colwellia sp.]|nr:VOC family protein [Colwellia sp.]